MKAEVEAWGEKKGEVANRKERAGKYETKNGSKQSNCIRFTWR